MRFPADLGWAILQGSKTTHRTPQPCKAGEAHTLQFPQAMMDSYGQPILNRQSHAVKYGTDALLVLSDVREERLGEIEGDPKALKAEGFLTLEAFARYWISRHDSAPVYRRSAARTDGETLSTETVFERWKEIHAKKTVYVLTLAVEYPDKPTLLAVDGHDAYTSSSAMALNAEPEAIRPALLTEMAKDNWTRFRGNDRLAKDQLNRLGRSLREEGIRAIRSGVDVSAELTNIERELDAIREKRAA